MRINSHQSTRFPQLPANNLSKCTLRKSGVGSTLTVAALFAFLLPSALAQPESRGAGTPSPDVTLSITALPGHAYWVGGGIANTGFVIGDKGVIAIDAQYFAVTAKNELGEIAKITPKPVNAIILTHSDPDHVNGLPAFPRGAEIIAQENAKAEIIAALADPHPAFTKPPAELKDYLPTRTVKLRKELMLDGVRLILIHTGPAHTDGDLVIFLPVQKIVFAGDLLAPAVGPYPGIHLEKHGASLGWIQSVKAMLALDANIFISGHGPSLSHAEVAARLATAEARRAEIERLVNEHMSLEQVKTTLHDAPLTGTAARFPTFTETTYQELTAHP